MKKKNLLILLLGVVVFTISCSKGDKNDVLAPKGISLKDNTLSLKVGESETLVATLTPKDAIGTVKWTSDKSDIAKVNDKGVVTAVAKGTAIIKATVGAYSANCTVTVTEEEALPVDLNLSSITYGGIVLEGFQADILSYDIQLPEGTVDIPQIAATAVAAALTEVTVTQAEALPGTATIVVAEKTNTANKKTYTINFTVESPGSGGSDCSGTSTEAREGTFVNGYTYSFKTAQNGDVVVEFELLDQQVGLVAFAQFNPGTPDFREEGPFHPVEGQKFTQTFTPAEGTTVLKLAWKFAFAGGLGVTKVFEYEIGKACN